MKAVVLLACAVTVLGAATAGGQARGGGAPRPAAPAPRWPDGTINLGAVPGAPGLWDGAEPLATNPKNYETVAGRPRPGLIDLAAVPLQPWAKALLDVRHARFLADEPYTRCKPSPAARSFGTAYGVELLNLPGADRIYLFQTGGAHSFRVIYLDGRTHPATPSARAASSAFGHSIGWWDRDTLVIDTVGIDESAWLERWGLPHTNRLHTIERITRPDFDTLKYELTVDDPGAYTAPWTSGYTKRWSSNQETFEYVCQENNYGPQMMIGVAGGAMRTSAIVP
jgi:hypothetical protein